MVVLVYLGEGQRGGAAAVAAAALLGSRRSNVVLVVRDVSASALATAEETPPSALSANEVSGDHYIRLFFF